MSKFIVQRVLVYTEKNDSIQLWKRYEGFDVVVIENNDVSFCNFYEDYDTAFTQYDTLKQQIFKTQEEKLNG